MQMIKPSILLSALLFASAVNAEEYVTTQLMFYDEDEETTKIVAPSFEVSLDFGADYTLVSSFSVDSVSGASKTYYDKSFDTTSSASPYKHAVSSPSAFDRGEAVSADEIGYGFIDYYDIRFAGAMNLTKRLESSRDEVTVGIAYSNEYDYHIPGVSFSYLHWLDSSKNSALNGSFAMQKADVLVWCRQNEACDTNSGASDIFNQYNYNAELAYSQVIDAKSQAKLALFYAREAGYLNNQYMNIVRERTDALYIESENRPNKRKAYGIKIDYDRAMSDALTLQTGYRYYRDDWEIDSHTIETDLLYEYSKKLTLEAGLRYYTQDAASFYKAQGEYFSSEEYGSNDLRLSDLESMNYLLGVDYQSSDALDHYFFLNYYEQDNDTYAIAVIIGQTYRF